MPDSAYVNPNSIREGLQGLFRLPAEPWCASGVPFPQPLKLIWFCQVPNERQALEEYVSELNKIGESWKAEYNQSIHAPSSHRPKFPLNLPKETFITILGQCSWDVLAKLGLTSKDFDAWATTGDMWARHLETFFPEFPRPPLVSARDFFRTRYQFVAAPPPPAAETGPSTNLLCSSEAANDLLLSM